MAKATFAFIVDGPMRLVAPDDVHPSDIHHDENPARSLRIASDLVPYRTHADVVLIGNAPVPEESTTVRLAVYRDRALIDKSFDVVPSGDLEGSHLVPLVYEHSPGGPEWDDNPVGTSLPSLVDSSDPQRPVGFGPIASTWPARARRLGAFDPRGLSLPIPVLPDDLDWRYYSAAPADQVAEYLQGDEWIVLENLIAGRPMVRMQLPQTHAEARIFGLSPAPIVKMLADNLHLDLDRGVASITWRGSFEVAGEETMRALSVMVGVAVAGQPIVWPTLPPPRREPVAPPAVPRAPPPPPARASVPDSPFESTMTMSGDEADHAIGLAQALPFGPARAARTEIREPSYSFDETAIIDDEPDEMTVPMAKAFARTGPGASARPSQGIPGAPWSGVPAAPVPHPHGDLNESTRAIRRDELLARLGPTPPAQPPASLPAIPAATPDATPIVAAAAPPPLVAAAAPPGEPARAWSWASVADAPKVEMNPPPPPRPPPAPAVKNALYNRFTAKK